MSRKSGARISPLTRGVIYVATGSVISLPHFTAVPTWYGWLILVLAGASIGCYLKYERKNGSKLIFVTGMSAGVWIDALIALSDGRLSHKAIVLLLVASITALIWAAYTDFMSARRR